MWVCREDASATESPRQRSRDRGRASMRRLAGAIKAPKAIMSNGARGRAIALVRGRARSAFKGRRTTVGHSCPSRNDPYIHSHIWRLSGPTHPPTKILSLLRVLITPRKSNAASQEGSLCRARSVVGTSEPETYIPRPNARAENRPRLISPYPGSSYAAIVRSARHAHSSVSVPC